MSEEILELQIGGMHCSACPVRIERVVSKLAGVLKVQVNLTTEKALVHIQPGKIDLPQIVHAIENIGFTATRVMKNRSDVYEKSIEDVVLKRNFMLAVILTIPLAWANLIHFEWASNLYIPSILLHPFSQLALAIPIQFIIGFPFYERAWKAIKSGYANMDVLIVLSTSAAFFYSHYLTFTSIETIEKGEPMVLYYETSAFIITFILLGRLLEARTKTRTTKAIKDLYYLQTETAFIEINGEEQKARVDSLTYGDIIVVKPGDKLPIDGNVIQGSSTIDESLLTGESLPTEKNIGHAVYAGTMNIGGVLKIQVTKQESETVLSQIIRIVEDAQLSKPPIQRIADRVVQVFVPVVIVIAAVTFVLSYLMLQPGEFSAALEKVIAVLIIACPCALGLATPTSIMVGSGRAAQLGILFKEGAILELLGKYKTIIVDKTGTLTKGKPSVTDLYVKDFSRQEFLAMVGAIEKTSNHPVAQAIIHEAESIKRPIHEADHVQSIPGHGLTGMVNHKEVMIVNRTYVQESSMHLPFEAREVITTLENEGKTVMIVFIESLFAGIIAVTDALKPSAKEVMKQMKQMDVHISMLTGDNIHVANQVAKEVGIKHVQAEVTPQEKSAIIQDIQQNGTGVIMIGDGMNDAPALAVADIGIALGTGSDITIESGDVTIMKGDLQKVIQAMTISQQTMRNIKQNLGWSFLYNVVMIPFAMFGLLAPWIAAAAMALSSVSVVLNSLRLHWTTL